MSTALLCCAFAALPLPKPPAEQVIRLSVSPAAAPKPALRYQLLPELTEMQPGNPIAGYLKVLLDQDNTTAESNLGPAALREADRAARLEKPDWQILIRLKADGIQLLLPDLQKMRELAAGLQGRFREEIAQRRYDDALVTAKTMFALARHTGEHPTLIGNLVGIAIGAIALQTLEEMLDQPGCPNLYWALTDLPYPLISVARGVEGERVMMHSEFRDLSNREPMTADQIKKVIDHIELIRKFDEDRVKQTTKQWVSVRARDANHIAAARARLVESGRSAETLAKFPPEQIVLLDEVREFECRRDEATKHAKLSTWEFEAFTAKLPVPKEQALLGMFLPAFRKVRLAQGRIEQRVSLLRHVEATRMFAAENGGKLPSKLDDISVPLPVDPFTGKPFKFSRDGDAVHIRGTAPHGFDQVPAYNLHYEITIRK